ncbi:hypothetical protein GCM10007979_52530 [Nocardioides albus]|nr:hypothetical protein GCM10007979_52530 [Nocardioides albus]
MHDDELMIDEHLVRSLLRRDLAAYADLPLRPLTSTGSTNRLFRLGEEWLARLPRQPGGSAAITQEARWLPELAASVPVATPEVLTVGEPGFGYPERWSVVRWIEGEKPRPGAGDVTAEDLAEAVTGLCRTAVPDEAISDPELRWYRGQPIADFDSDFRSSTVELRKILDLDDDTWLRARAWALFIAVMTFPYYWETMRGRCADRLVMARGRWRGERGLDARWPLAGVVAGGVSDWSRVWVPARVGPIRCLGWEIYKTGCLGWVPCGCLAGFQQRSGFSLGYLSLIEFSVVFAGFSLLRMVGSAQA